MLLREDTVVRKRHTHMKRHTGKDTFLFQMMINNANNDNRLSFISHDVIFTLIKVILYHLKAHPLDENTL